MRTGQIRVHKQIHFWLIKLELIQQFFNLEIPQKHIPSIPKQYIKIAVVVNLT